MKRAGGKKQTAPALPPMFPTPERAAKGNFGEARTYEFDQDEAAPVRRAVRTVRDLNATASARLARCPNLSPAQTLAGAMFERDWEMSKLEPRMTPNLSGAGGGKLQDMPSKILTARDRIHHARNALRMGGQEVMSIVESVVLSGASVTQVGQTRFKNRNAASAHVNLALSVGLSLLESHYRVDGRMA